MAGGTTGWNGTSPDTYWLNEVWRIDSSGKWTSVSGHSGWQARQNPGFVAAKDVAVLAGGEAWHPPTQDKDTWNDVWQMSLATGEFKQMATAPWEARTGHAMEAIDDDTVLMAGGGSCRSCMFIKKFNDVWKYSAKSDKWTRLKDAPWRARWFHGLAATSTGDVVMAGGQAGFLSDNDVWKMDKTGEWTQITAKAPWGGRSQFGFTASPVSPFIVLAGGMDGGNDSWQMNMATMQWTRLSDLPGSNFGPALTVWGDDRVVISGGSVPCEGWHCGSQQFVETSKQWVLQLNVTAAH